MYSFSIQILQCKTLQTFKQMLPSLPGSAAAATSGCRTASRCLSVEIHLWAPYTPPSAVTHLMVMSTLKTQYIHSFPMSCVPFPACAFTPSLSEIHQRENVFPVCRDPCIPCPERGRRASLQGPMHCILQSWAHRETSKLGRVAWHTVQKCSQGTSSEGCGMIPESTVWLREYNRQVARNKSLSLLEHAGSPPLFPR